MVLVETTRIRVEAPDGAAAFRLEERLAHLHASAVERRRAWGVELEPTTDREEEIVAAIRHWLREIGHRSTRVTIGGAAHTIAIDDGEPLGTGYDEGALEHEP